MPKTKLETQHAALFNNFEAVEFAYCDPKLKKSFHLTAARYLKALAVELGLVDGSYEIRSNKGGIAGSGEITLHSDRLYCQIHEAVFSTGISFLIRSCESRKDYTGGHNDHRKLRVNNSAEILEACKLNTRKD